jgi:hypothetical protein
MYWKLEDSGHSVYQIVVALRYDLFLDEGDQGYDQHHVFVPIIPEGGYQGKVDETGKPVDMDDYQKWFSGLPIQEQNNPFCCHFCLFNPDFTDDDVIKAGDEILALAYQNWCDNNLPANNQYSINSDTKAACQDRLTAVRATDYVALKTAANNLKSSGSLKG